ncbi:TadE/TadG family type IV pilus assembly protein [Dongia sp.]|uniref:TadE/TadG family type IV pilus assembly protein n=1 Tax=Dongia sp. TaxID=1977262 RepID=UPI0035AFE63C
MFNQFKHLLSRLRRCERGAPAVEFALVAPLLILMLMGTLDFGLAVRAKSETEAAARAALQKGFGNMWDTVAMTTAAKAALSYDPTVQDTLALSTMPSCYCNGVLTDSGDTCTKESTCGGGGRPEYYLTINVTRTYDMLLDYFIVSDTLNLTASATARTQP